MCMKCNIPNNVRMVGLVILGLVVIYIALSIFASTREGLSDGTTTSNTAVIKTTQTNQTNASTVMGKLPASTNAYVDLINSYKYLKLANGINDLVTKKTTTNLTSITDYDEAIDYLSTLSSSSTPMPTAISSVISANDASTKAILDKLSADNQAYIDLIMSYKKLKLANGINDVAAGKTTMLVSDCDHAVDYLNELSGTISTKPSSSLDSLPTQNTSLTR